MHGMNERKLKYIYIPSKKLRAGFIIKAAEQKSAGPSFSFAKNKVSAQEQMIYGLRYSIGGMANQIVRIYKEKIDGGRYIHGCHRHEETFVSFLDWPDKPRTVRFVYV